MSNNKLTNVQLVLTLVASVAASVAVSTLLSSQLNNKMSLANVIFGNKHVKHQKGKERRNHNKRREGKKYERSDSDSDDCSDSDCSTESISTNTNNIDIQHNSLPCHTKQNKERLLKPHHTSDTITPMRTSSPEWHSPHACENDNTSCTNTKEVRDMSRTLSYRSVHSSKLEHASSLRFLTHHPSHNYCSSSDISKSNKNNNFSSTVNGDVTYKKSDLPINSPLSAPECIIPSLPSVPIYRIVITGGPCSGKSTCLSYLKKELEESLHFKVYCVPEVATLLMLGGVKLWRDEADASLEAAEQLKQEAIEEAMTEFEKTLLSMQEFRQELAHVHDELLSSESEDDEDEEENDDDDSAGEDDDDKSSLSEEELLDDTVKGESDVEKEDSNLQNAKLTNGRVMKNGNKMALNKQNNVAKRNNGKELELSSSEEALREKKSEEELEQEATSKQSKKLKKQKSKKSKVTESLSRIRIITQRIVLEMMLKLEDAFAELASLRHEPAVILCDRGTMDGSAYCSTEEWNAIVDLLHCSDAELRDARYDAVIHFVTAALGAEPYYTLANNATRRETVSEAIAMDFNTRNAWRGHYLMYVVDNSTNFEMKLHRAAEFIRKLVGVDENVIFESNNHYNNDNNPLCPSMGTTPLSPPSEFINGVIDVNENGTTEENNNSYNKNNVDEHEVQELAFLMTGNRCCRSLSSLRVSRARSEYQHTSPLLPHLHNRETNINITTNNNGKDGSNSEEKDSVRLSTNTNNSDSSTSDNIDNKNNKSIEIEPEPRNPEEGIPQMNGENSRSNHLHQNNVNNCHNDDDFHHNTLSTRVMSPGHIMSSWEEGALVGVQRHFIVTHVDKSHIPHNAVRAEITIIFLKPTQREFVSEMIIRRVSLPYLKTYNDNTTHSHGVKENYHNGKQNPEQQHQHRNNKYKHKIECKSSSAFVSNKNKTSFHENTNELLHENNEGEHIYIRRVEYANLQIDHQTDNNGTANVSSSRHKGVSARNVCTRLISKEVFLQLSRHYDPLQPLVQKYTTRFVHDLHHFTLVAFRKPAALNGVVRLIAPADMSIDQLPTWITVDESISMTNNDVIMERDILKDNNY